MNLQPPRRYRIGQEQGILLGMPAELFVDLRYKGIDLGRGLRLEDMTSSSAYLQHPTPMPVGAKLIMDADSLEVSICVTGVREQVAEAERAPGMFVEPDTLNELAQQWWDDNVASAGSAESSESEPDASLQSQQLEQGPEAADTQITEVPVPAAEVAVEQAEFKDTVEMAAVEDSQEVSKAANKSKSKKRRSRRKKSK